MLSYSRGSPLKGLGEWAACCFAWYACPLTRHDDDYTTTDSLTSTSLMREEMRGDAPLLVYLHAISTMHRHTDRELCRRRAE